MRALAVAFAAGVFALVTRDIGRLAHYLGSLRLTVIGVGSVAAITVTIMVTTGLWGRSPHRAARKQVALFNIVTTATVGLGVAALYLALFLAMLAAALLLVPRGNLLWPGPRAPGLGGRSGSAWAWLATSIATPGGALGAALEAARPCARQPIPTSRAYADRCRRLPGNPGSHGSCQRGLPSDQGVRVHLY